MATVALTLPSVEQRERAFFSHMAVAVLVTVLAGFGLFFGVAMIWDKRHRGAVHPAYYWGAGALVAWVTLSFAIASLPPVLALTKSLAG
jgi:cytochrome b subunit of formate dehydrogenase